MFVEGSARTSQPSLLLANLRHPFISVAYFVLIFASHRVCTAFSRTRLFAKTNTGG